MVRILRIAFLAFIALGAAACSGSATPQLIAAYPAAQQPPDYSVPALAYPPTLAPCAAYTSLEVYASDDAAARAERLASSFGAYVTSDQSWTSDGRKYSQLTILVPAPGFHALREKLFDLGYLLDDSRMGEADAYSGAYCRISLTLVERTTLQPHTGWSPVRTLKDALRLSFTILRYLVDAAIWIAVVLGPLVLMALGIRALLVRRAKPNG